MRIALALLLLTAAAGGSAMARSSASVPHPADFPMPGYWETTTKVESIIHQTKTEKHCYTPADVGKLLRPCNHMHVCEYSVQDARDGRLTLKGQWVNKKNHQVIDVAGVGNYAPDSMTAEARMHTSLFGIPLSGTGQLSAHRLGSECPAEPEKH